jgi:hypothetical protein
MDSGNGEAATAMFYGLNTIPRQYVVSLVEPLTPMFLTPFFPHVNGAAFNRAGANHRMGRFSGNAGNG